MLKYTMSVQHPALFVKPRLGKTLVTIRRCKLYKDCSHFLICAPYSAEIAWEDELKGEGEGQLIEISGKVKDRVNLLKEHWESNKWFFASKESNIWCPDVLLFPWDVVIVDEGTFLKDPKSKVSKFFVKYFRDTKHRWDLTGTPDPNGPMDFFQQLKYLDNSNLPQYRNFWDFRDKAFTLQNSRTYNYEITRRGRKNLSKCLAKKCFFMDRKQAGIKEIRVDSPRRFKLPPKLLKAYIDLEKEFSLKIDDIEFRTKWAPVRFDWLRDICNGFIRDDFVWSGKLEEIKYQLRTELKGEKVIIYATRKKYLKMLYKELSKNYKVGLVYGDIPIPKRKPIYRKFQSGKLDILIANPDCVQYSLDFSISDTIIYYNQVYKETRLQADERIFKVGKKGGLLYMDLIVEDSVESEHYENRLEAEDESYMIRLFTKRAKEKYGQR